MCGSSPLVWCSILSNPALRYWQGHITRMTGNNVMVFGSNPEGRHGKGVALLAREACGAIYGQGRGLQGNAYALPTKNLKAGYIEPATGICYPKAGAQSISLDQIRENIIELYGLARSRSELTFFVCYTASGSNLNGYSPNQIFEQFVRDIDVPSNLRFHNSFRGIEPQKIEGPQY